jgi:hypothetical protein
VYDISCRYGIVVPPAGLLWYFTVSVWPKDDRLQRVIFLVVIDADLTFGCARRAMLSTNVR